MRNIIIDTCVLIHIIRDSITGKKCIEIIEKLDENPNLIISVVTKAEIESFSKQNNWGKSKIDMLSDFLKEITVVDISNVDSDLMANYSLIDAYSKRKVPNVDGNLLSGSARKMGKNDLWIASTALTLGIPLMTCDGDFDHLNSSFLEIIKI